MELPPVQYVTTSDSFNIAYAVSGEGRPFVLMPQPHSHIQLYWTKDTFVRPWLEGLASRFRLVQYDGRGQGMSSRGLPENLALDDFGRDLEAVVERLRLHDFVLMATAICHVPSAMQSRTLGAFAPWCWPRPPSRAPHGRRP